MSSTTSADAPITDRAASPKKKGPGGMKRVLDAIERVGNKIPHPTVIFAALIVALVIFSHIFYAMGASVTYDAIDLETHALTESTASVKSLLTAEGIRFMYAEVVQNFMNFNALGVVIVAMLGVGVAEAAGLIGALIRKLVAVARPAALTYIIVFVGVLSSIAADAGYLVLVPLAASAYASVGRHPIAGLAASFAGVAAVFGVNLLIKPLDGILTEITNDAIHLVDPSVSMAVTGNWWFGLASVFLLTIVCALVTDKLVEPRLGPWQGAPAAAKDVTNEPEAAEAPENESRGLRYALLVTLVVVAVFVLLSAPSGAPLRDPESGILIGDSPFMTGLIVAITILFFAAGVAYGIGARTFTSLNDVTGSMEKAVAGLAGLIFLLFFISQFIAFFNYSNLATVAAVKIGDGLENAGLGPLTLLIGLVFVTLILDIFMSGIIPKWAIFAPIFVPLLMRLGVEPEAALAAYRLGDSPFNVLSPLMPYFALIVTFAHRYDKSAGVGTLVALMLPYVVLVLLSWTLLLILWQVTGLPWGF